MIQKWKHSYQIDEEVGWNITSFFKSKLKSLKIKIN